MKTVQRLGSDIDGSHETERRFRRRQVIIDRFWHADHRKSALMKLLRNSQRAFAAEYDQGLDTQNVQVSQGLRDRHLGKARLPVDHLDKAAPISRTKDRSAAGQDTGDTLAIKLSSVRFA